LRVEAVRAVALAFALAASPAAAQQCADRQTVVDHLGGKFQEAPTGRGVSNGHMVEVWVSATGTWTVVVTSANGNACMVASGHAWETVDPAGAKPNL
jgi:hypothetical protein